MEISLRLWVLALVMRIEDNSENLNQKYSITIGIFPNSFGINPYISSMTSSDSAQRFALLRKELGFTQSEFGTYLGLSGSTADIERAKTKLPGYVVAKLYEEHSINPSWLFGTSDKMRLGSSTVQTLPKVITVNSEQKENVLLVEAKAAAGYPQNILDRSWYQKLPAFDLPLKEFRNATYRGFQVEGDSMLPALNPGDWVLARAVESLDTIRPSKMYVVVLEDSVMVKKVIQYPMNNRLTLQSLNPNYEPYEVHAYQIQELWEVSSKITFVLEQDQSLQLLNELKDSMRELKERMVRKA